MVDFKQLVEAAKVHPMAVHAYSVGGGRYKVHATGSEVNKQYVKPGDHIRSSDLDDLSDSGYKVKEIQKPKDMKEDVEQISEISTSTLVSYGSKAQKQVKGNQPADPDKLRKRTNREQGIKLAYNKFYNFKAKVPATVKEEAQAVEEMSAAYKKMLKYQKKKKSMGEETESFNSASQDESKSDIRSLIHSSLEEAKQDSSSAASTYKSLHAELGDHIKKLVQMHKAMDPSKVQSAQKYVGRDIDWGHVGSIHSHLELIKRITEPADAAKKQVKEEVEQIDEISSKNDAKYGSAMKSDDIYHVTAKGKGYSYDRSFRAKSHDHAKELASKQVNDAVKRPDVVFTVVHHDSDKTKTYNNS